MEIIKRQSADVLELSVKGRLDSYWADDLASALGEAIGDGAHKLKLNLSEVTFLSSAGIRVLLQFHKQLNSIHGSLVVSSPSDAVKNIFDITGLEKILVTETTSPTVAPAPATSTRQLDRAGVTYEVFDCAPGTSLRCRVIGNPELLKGCRFAEEHCRTMAFSQSSFALGLGAFGNDFEDCRGRFGEFLAVAGAAAYLPTDGTNIPDYLVSAGTLVPDLKVLYCLTCEGTFAQLVRFETNKEVRAVTLSGLVDASLAIAGSDAVGILIVAEPLGLAGAALRRSPALSGSQGAPFEHPEVREWLSFTTERVHSRSVALIVGVGLGADHEPLRPMIRPLGKGPWPAGHFHATAFSYRPLRRGQIELRSTVSTLFEAETLQGVLHLLNDDRPIVGVGESEFVRGACWIGPLSAIVEERN